LFLKLWSAELFSWLDPEGRWFGLDDCGFRCSGLDGPVTPFFCGFEAAGLGFLTGAALPDDPSCFEVVGLLFTELLDLLNEIGASSSSSNTEGFWFTRAISPSQ
jgi:hypothetical protein